jgi:hypothetical protein
VKIWLAGKWRDDQRNVLAFNWSRGRVGDAQQPVMLGSRAGAGTLRGRWPLSIGSSPWLGERVRNLIASVIIAIILLADVGSLFHFPGS